MLTIFIISTNPQKILANDVDTPSPPPSPPDATATGLQTDGESTLPAFEEPTQALQEPTIVPTPTDTGEPTPAAETPTPEPSDDLTDEPTPEPSAEPTPEPTPDGQGQITISPLPEALAGGGTYTADADGFKQALYDIYQHGANADYTLLISGGLDISGAEGYAGRKGGGDIATYEDITLDALAGKAASLTFAAREGSEDAWVKFGEPAYFATPIVMDMAYEFTAFYMCGNDLLLGSDSEILGDTAKDIYAGSDAPIAAGSSTITVNAAGAGTLNLHGETGAADALATLDIDAPGVGLGMLTGDANTVIIVKDIGSIGGIDSAGAANFVGEAGSGREFRVGSAGISSLASLSVDCATLGVAGDVDMPGDIVLEQGGVLAVEKSGSAGGFIVNGSAELRTPAGSFNIEAYRPAEGARLHAVITAGEAAQMQGRWYGISDAYVLFNISGGADITPLSIYGEKGEQQLICDSGEGHILLLPGNIADAVVNEVELHAVSKIITESEAMAIEGPNGVKALNEASGQPYFGHSINSTLLKAIQEGLAGENIREHEITYTAGVMGEEGSYLSTTVKLIVVPDDYTTISEDGQYALYAKDVSLSVDTLHDLDDEQQLAEYTQAAVISAEGDMGSEGIEVEAGAMDSIAAVDADEEVPVQLMAMTRSGLLARGVGVLGLDDVCRIGDVYYSSLEEAIAAAQDTYAPATIEIMTSVVDVEHMDIKHVITGSSSYRLTITSAPELGDRATINFQTGSHTELISVYGSRVLTLENLVLSGSSLTNGNVELINAKSASIHNSFRIKNSTIRDFDISRPLITINTPNCTISNTEIIDNTSTSANGLIYSTQPYNLENGYIGGGIIGYNYTPNGSVLNHVGGMDMYFQNAYITQNHVGASGYAVNLPNAPQYLAYWNYIYDNYRNQEQRNVYLGQATVGDSKGFCLFSPDGDTMYQSGKVGFMTQTSSANGGIGVEHTIIATMDYFGFEEVPDGYIDIFFHDQVQHNPDALGVIKDPLGQMNLVLGVPPVKKVEVAFTKVDATNHSRVLSDAGFHLYYCEQPHATHAELVTDALVQAGSCWQPVMDGEEIKTFVSDQYGLLKIGGLDNGEYMLVEHKAPAGFMRPIGQWLLEVDNTATGDERLVISGMGDMMPPAFAHDDTTGDLLLPNMPSYKGINTGDGGIRNFIILGAGLIAAGAAVFILERRRQARNNPTKQKG